MFLYLYNKDNNTLTLATNGVSILNGNIELNLKEYGDYIVTRANIQKETKSESPITSLLGGNGSGMASGMDFKMVAIIEAGAIVLLILVVIARGKRK